MNHSSRMWIYSSNCFVTDNQTTQALKCSTRMIERRLVCSHCVSRTWKPTNCCSRLKISDSWLIRLFLTRNSWHPALVLWLVHQEMLHKREQSLEESVKCCNSSRRLSGSQAC